MIRNPALEYLASDLVGACGVGHFVVAGADAATIADFRSRSCIADAFSAANPITADWLVLVGDLPCAERDAGEFLQTAASRVRCGIAFRSPTRQARTIAERHAAEAGLVRHPRYLALAPHGHADHFYYDSLMRPSISASEASDRETEDRAARYFAAAARLCPGDTVLDLGAGGAILAANSLAAEVSHIDPDDIAAILPDSVGAMISLDDPDLDLAQIAADASRVLWPGGRLFALARSSSRAEDAVSRHLLVEQITSGSAPGLTVIVAMKNPADGAGTPYVERILGRVHPPALALDWTLLYDNPWLGHFMVSGGFRPGDRAKVKSVAERVMTTSREGSPDRLAALCVLGYQLLGAADRATAEAWRNRLAPALAAVDPAHPAVLRWRVSLAFLDGCLLEEVGDAAGAISRFNEVCAADISAFHPSLLTKKASAGLKAARLAASSGDYETAMSFAKTSVSAAFEFQRSAPTETFGLPDRPQGFFLKEGAEILLTASHAADAIEAYEKAGEAAFRIALAERRRFDAQAAGAELQWMRGLTLDLQSRLERFERLQQIPLLRPAARLLLATARLAGRYLATAKGAST